VEQLAALRAIPGLTVIRPADATETAAAWRFTLQHTDGPVALILSRQNLPVIDRRSAPPAGLLAGGAYRLTPADEEVQALLIASGSEVALALRARELLSGRGITAGVVSMPSWELFERMPADYRERVLPPAVAARVVVEAGISQGWERYAGASGVVVGVAGFGASAPGDTVLEKFGFTAERVAAAVLEILGRPAA
jgi:transketolase